MWMSASNSPRSSSSLLPWPKAVCLWYFPYIYPVLAEYRDFRLLEAGIVELTAPGCRIDVTELFQMWCT